MHLINIKTLRLEEFVEGSIPPYAILSHRWTNDELTFKEVIKGRPQKRKKGYQKLVKACEVTARSVSVDYLWIDTCCIDKRSSAELSESINSMFSWYQNAEICIAYLEDIKWNSTWNPEDTTALEDYIGSSVWFTRSWTLQELIAPEIVKFFDGNWACITDKEDSAKWLSRVTGIDPQVLSKKRKLSECSIADRMAWAANRTASRSEDIAYSLMGIFDVNMALLYGEGMKAFGRLQEEIMGRAQDPTFLIWGHQDEHSSRTSRLLAKSPADFRKSKYKRINRSFAHKAFDISNIGLEIEIDVTRWSMETYGLLVGFGDFENGEHARFILLVRKPPRSSAFCKLGFVSLPVRQRGTFTFSDTTDLVESKKLVILWGHDGQLDELTDVSVSVKVSYGFAIEVRTISPAYITDMQSEEKWELPQDQDHTSTRLETASIMHFHTPTKISVAKIACTIASSSLRIFLSFDIDSCPWALIYSDWTPPPRFAVVDQLSTIHTRRFLEEQTAMIKIPNKVTTGTLYAFCGSTKQQFPTSAEVPEELLPNGATVILTFVAPHSYNNDSSFWIFRISEAARQGRARQSVESQAMCEVSGYPRYDTYSPSLESASQSDASFDCAELCELEGEPRFATYSKVGQHEDQRHAIPFTIRQSTAQGLRAAIASSAHTQI